MSRDDGNWGFAVYPDGSRVPLEPPPSLIPEDEREPIYTGRSGLVMWTRRAENPPEQ